MQREELGFKYVHSMLFPNKCDFYHTFLIKVLKIWRTPSNIINTVVSSLLGYTVSPLVTKVQSWKSGSLKSDKKKLKSCMRMKCCFLVRQSGTDPNQIMIDHTSLCGLCPELGDCHGLYPPLQYLSTL